MFWTLAFQKIFFKKLLCGLNFALNSIKLHPILVKKKTLKLFFVPEKSGNRVAHSPLTSTIFKLLRFL